MPDAKQIGSIGDTPGRFAYPRAIDSDGKTLWVADKSGRVQRIDPKTGDCLGWFTMPEYVLGKPVGMTVVTLAGRGGGAGEQFLYVADTHYHRVMVYRIPGESGSEDRGGGVRPELVSQFGEYGTGDGQFIYPTDVAVVLTPDRTGVERIYVSEYGGNDRISVFDPAHKFQFSFGRNGPSASPESIEFERPQSIELVNGVDGRPMELLVADSRNCRVGRFTLDGKLVAWYGSPEADPADPNSFNYPYGLALPGDGTALVVEFAGNRVRWMEIATGRTLGLYGRPGSMGGELASPWAVALLDGRAYVVDARNNRLVSFPAPRGKG